MIAKWQEIKVGIIIVWLVLEVEMRQSRWDVTWEGEEMKEITPRTFLSLAAQLYQQLAAVVFRVRSHLLIKRVSTDCQTHLSIQKYRYLDWVMDWLITIEWNNVWLDVLTTEWTFDRLIDSLTHNLTSIHSFIDYIQCLIRVQFIQCCRNCTWKHIQ